MEFKIWDQAHIQKQKHDKVFNTETMLPISEIKNNTIILKDGSIRSILKITGLNLDLKNYNEQEIVLQQYKKFLNWLSFPIQILVRNTYLDLSNYLNYIWNNISKLTNKTLKSQWEWYLKFLENIDMQKWLIYVKEFYIIVPLYSDWNENKQINKSRTTKIMNVLNAKDSIEKVIARYRWFLKNQWKLNTRVSLIKEGLWSMGIPTEQLNTSQIINLLFRCYNPLLHSSQADMSE